MQKKDFTLPLELSATEKAVDKFLEIDSNAFDNYNHRNIRASFIIRCLWTDFTLAPGRTGVDSTCKSRKLIDIEMKTSNLRANEIPKDISKIPTKCFNKMFMFDKQDRANRQKFILKVDGLVFSVFVCEKLFFVAWSDNKDTMQVYREIVEKKQSEFLKKWQIKQQYKIDNDEDTTNGSKSGHDAITVGLKDFPNVSIWNFYYNNSLYVDESIEQIKKILGVE